MGLQEVGWGRWGGGMDWIVLNQNKYNLSGRLKRGNKLLGFIKCGEFLV